jgi:hypothetical protein
MRAAVVALCTAAACAVIALACASWGLRSFDIDDDAVVIGATAAAERWPEVAPIVDRLDVFGYPRARLATACRAPETVIVEGCALWPGSELARGRILVANDVDVVEIAAIVEHELQHLRPSVWALDDACGDHRAECWED